MKGFAEDLDTLCSDVFLWDVALGTNGCETIVGRACECDEVDLRGWLGDGDFARVADGDFEEGGS